MTEQSPSTTNIQKRPHKTIRQRLGAPFLLWLVCIPVTFVTVYSIAWFGYRDNSNVQGTFHWITSSKVSLMAWKLDEYYKKFESYPLTLNHLFADVAPDTQIPEDQIELVQKDVDRETWVKHGMQDNDWMKIIYESDGNTYSFSHFGKDNKPGGIGIDTDVTYTAKDFKSGSVFHDARKTSPTFKQFLFEMDGSRAIFKTALVLNLFLLFAIGLQFSRTSDRVQLGVAVLYCLFLIPTCSAIAMLLTVLHLDIANSSGH